jgi:DNA-binding transcriptional MerR regulator
LNCFIGYIGVNSIHFRVIMAQTQTSAAAYRSGTAARLAGIPVATLRVWERRYDVIGPNLSDSGHRRYSPEDVNRLALIKTLVDQGHPIGSIAHLPTETLRALPSPTATLERPAAVPRVRVAVVGESLAAQVTAGRGMALDVVASCADPAEAAEALRDARAAWLVIELPALREDSVASIESLAALLGAARALVAYRFGTQPAVRALRQRGHVVVRAPLDLAEVPTLAVAPAGAEARPLAQVPPPRFDERTLAALGTAPNGMYCECPRHVAEILRSLGAFERYSAECLNRSAADADLHRYLERVAGTARTLFEDALEQLARAEGLPLTVAT